MDELEAKNAFLLEKANKIGAELKEEKEEQKKALDKLNLALAFNQKLETYVGNTGDVINKAKLFDANLAKNPVTAGKVIPIVVTPKPKKTQNSPLNQLKTIEVT